MFGYVTINKPELKMKDFARYQAYYCGLCRTLKERYGRVGQMTLTYDMTFLILLLTSLYESETTCETGHCLIHPVKKHEMLSNAVTNYAADMNILLSYYHLLDDWKDEKSKKGLIGARLLLADFRRIKKTYPRQCRVIKKSLKRLRMAELREETNIDLVARCFGELMAELMVYRQDQWEKPLRRLGFYLGKFIYIMDAYDDIDKDRISGSYNPLKSLYEQSEAEFDALCQQMLMMMMAECTREFEKLPCVLDAEIIRNILYAGVWNRVHAIQKQKEEKKEEKTNDSRSL